MEQTQQQPTPKRKRITKKQPVASATPNGFVKIEEKNFPVKETNLWPRLVKA